MLKRTPNARYLPSDYILREVNVVFFNKLQNSNNMRAEQQIASVKLSS